MPSHLGSYDGKGDHDNYLHLFEGSILNYKDLKAKFRSYFSQHKKFTKTYLAVHNIKQREGESTRAFVTRSIVEFLSTYLLTTYKGLVEKTYTWIEAKEVATNRTLNDHREGFNRFKKNSSWDSNKGKKNKDMFSLYRGSNHVLLSNLSKSPREILATDTVAKTFKQPPRMIGSRRLRNMTKYCHFHEDHGHYTNDFRELKHQIEEVVKSGQVAYLVKGIKKGKAKASNTQQGDQKKGNKDIAPTKAPILKISRQDRIPKRKSTEEPVNKLREITFPFVSGINSSSDPVIINARIFGRQVNPVYLDSGSSCEVIYEHCFLKLKSSLRSLRVDSKVPLVGFSREHSWPLREVPLEIRISDSPLTRTEVTMDNPNITMEDYIRLEEEKARRRAIVFYDTLTSEVALSCEPMVTCLNNDEIKFRISFDESNNEDCTVIFDKKSFSYKIISVNNFKKDSENDNDKVNMPLLPSPKPTVSYFDDLNFFKDFENEFPSIVYNDAKYFKNEFSAIVYHIAQTSKSNLLTEPILNPQNIDVFNLKDETSLSECDEEEQNILNFNDLFPFNVIYPNDSKSDKDNDDDKDDIEHSSENLSVKPLPDLINTNVGAYAHGSNELLETSHNTSNKKFQN
ncbi:hypothetical protein Tco_0221789 [Tanacetum coccineum]